MDYIREELGKIKRDVTNCDKVSPPSFFLNSPSFFKTNPLKYIYIPHRP